MLLYRLIDLKQKMQLCMADRELLTASKGEKDSEVLEKDQEMYKMIHTYQEILSQLRNH